MLHASYIKVALDLKSFPKVVKLLARAIKKHAPDAEAVAFRGASGTLVGMSVCQELRLPPILVRKPEKTHSFRAAEGEIEAKKIVIVDDMIATGATVRSIMDGILTERIEFCIEEKELRCMGAFFYKELIDGRSHIYPEGFPYNGQRIPIIGVRKSLENFKR